MSATEHLLAFGKIGKPDDVVSVRFDEAAGTLTPLASVKVGLSPDYIERHPKHLDLLYIATRSDSRGKVTLARVSPDGQIKLLDSAETGLNDPSYMQFVPDASGLVISHFLGGGVTFLPINPDGSLAKHKPDHFFLPEYKPLRHPRQYGSHPHQVIIHGDEIIVPDQGCNVVYRLRYDPKSGFTLFGTLTDFLEGEGPRHGVVHPSGKFLYILGEMSCQVSVHTLPVPGTGESKCIQRIPIYPPSDAVHLAQIPMLASALKMKDGKLLATNRHSRWPERDAIAIVGINDDASLSPPLYHWPGLTHMRELSWSPDGRFLCAAGRDAGGVVMLDRNWNVVARLDMDNVAIQVWL